MTRPFVSVALVYVGGLLLGDWVRPPWRCLCAVSMGVAVLALVWRGARARLVWLLVFLAGWTNLVCRTAILSPHDLRATQREPFEIVTVHGVLDETPNERVYIRDEQEIARSLAHVQVHRILRPHAEWQPAYGYVLALTPGTPPKDCFRGDEVELTGVLASPPGPLAEGLFDYKTYLRRQGVYYQLKCESTNDWHLLTPSHPPPLSDRFLMWAHTTLSRGLPVEDESLRLLWAMTLGWTTGLTNEVGEPFMRSGTILTEYSA